MSKAITIKNLQFAYPSHTNKLILNIPSWDMNEGECVFLHGPSGSGKSTLLNLLSGTLNLHLSRVNEGEIEVLGQPMHLMSARQQDRFRASQLGVVFQQLNLISYLSVLDNIKLAYRFSKSDKPFSKHLLEATMQELHLSPSLIHSRVSDLSVGQQQRVAIVRALFHQPKLLIVDEPTSALDAQSTSSFMSLLLSSVKKLNASLIFVSHDMRLAQDFDRSVALSEINKQVIGEPS